MNQGNPYRDALDQLMSLRDWGDFERGFDEIKARYSLQLRILPNDPTWLKSNPTWLETFNCYAYALGIVSLSRYQDLVKKYKKELEYASALATAAFVSGILSRKEFKEIDERDAVSGDMVLYYQDDALQHGGKVSGVQMIHSKWGPNELFEHALWEVPASYGNRTVFLKAPNVEQIIQLLEEYCHNACTA